MKKAVFLDRDGVLVKNIDGDYIREKSQIELLPFAKGAVSRLNNEGFQIVIVTNQAAVNKGLIRLEEASAIQEEVIRLLDPTESMNIKSEICPHTKEDGCVCRKPEPGMLLAASKKYGLDLQNSFMVGDAWSDVEAALAANVRPIMVLSGRGKVSDIDQSVDSVRVFSHIGEAANYVCENTR